MVSQKVLVRRGGAVAEVTLNRPSRGNAVDTEMLELLVASVTDVANDPGCAVVVIGSAGDHFSSGWDTAGFAELGRRSAEELAAELCDVHRLLEELWAVPAVTVAGVQGMAAGFGLGLLAHVHVAIAAADARFALPEVRHGIAPAGVLVDLARVLPAKAVLDLTLTGEPVTAERARELGLVSRVVEPDALGAEVERLAGVIAGHPASGVTRALESHRRITAAPSGGALEAAAASAAFSVKQAMAARRPEGNDR